MYSIITVFPPSLHRNVYNPISTWDILILWANATWDQLFVLSYIVHLSKYTYLLSLVLCWNMNLMKANKKYDRVIHMLINFWKLSLVAFVDNVLSCTHATYSLSCSTHLMFLHDNAFMCILPCHWCMDNRFSYIYPGVISFCTFLHVKIASKQLICMLRFFFRNGGIPRLLHHDDKRSQIKFELLGNNLSERIMQARFTKDFIQ
jgi:hypothetical protein